MDVKKNTINKCNEIYSVTPRLQTHSQNIFFNSLQTYISNVNISSQKRRSKKILSTNKKFFPNSVKKHISPGSSIKEFERNQLKIMKCQEKCIRENNNKSNILDQIFGILCDEESGLIDSESLNNISNNKKRFLKLFFRILTK